MDETRNQANTSAAPDSASLERRLRDLEVTTRQYAKASQRGFGLAAVPVGLLFLASALLSALGHPVAAACVALAFPLILVIGSALARRRYQRLGWVDEDRRGVGAGRGWQ